MFQKRIRINHQIRIPEVRVIGADSEQLGVFPIEKALELAEEAELDLVEIAPTSKPPVCRIMDYSKYKYEQEKKERKARKNTRVTHLKQIRIKPHIDANDFQTKVKHARSFLEKKDKVKVNLFFAGRQMAFREQSKGLLSKFFEELSDIGQMEKDVVMEGRIMSIIVAPKSEKS